MALFHKYCFSVDNYRYLSYNISNMKEQNNQTPIVNKIEIDEKTSEPIIVEMPESELANQAFSDGDESVEIKKADFFEETKDAKTVSRQIVMKGLGLSKKENENINKRQKIFKLVFTIVFIVFVVGVLVFTFYKDFFSSGDRVIPSWDDLVDILYLGWRYFLFGLLALFLCYFFKALKLSILCKSLTGKFHFKTCFETGIIGHYYNYVTPLAVGGQPFEIYHLSKHGVHGGVASALPIATYVLNQFAFVILGIAFMIMYKYNALGMSVKLTSTFHPTFKVLAIIGLSLCFITPFLVFLFSLLPKFGAKLVHLATFLGGKLRLIKNPKKTNYKFVKNIVHNTQCLKKIFTKPIPAILCFLLSFLEHVASASIAYFALKAFGFDSGENNIFLEWLQIVQIVMMLTYAISFIPTPGNAGAADLSFFLLFSNNLAAGLAFPAMMLWRIMGFYSFIIIGFLFATLKKRSDKRKERLGLPLE